MNNQQQPVNNFEQYKPEWRECLRILYSLSFEYAYAADALDIIDEQATRIAQLENVADAADKLILNAHSYEDEVGSLIHEVSSGQLLPLQYALDELDVVKPAAQLGGPKQEG
jgi:hypothetical protein